PRTQAVTMLDGTLQQPGHGLQAGMRMGPDLHPWPLPQLLRPVVVEETPGTDHPHLTVRQSADPLIGLAQRHPPSGDQQLLRSARGTGDAHLLARPRIKVTHAAPHSDVSARVVALATAQADRSAIESDYGREY